MWLIWPKIKTQIAAHMSTTQPLAEPAGLLEKLWQISNSQTINYRPAWTQSNRITLQPDKLSWMLVWLGHVNRDLYILAEPIARIQLHPDSKTECRKQSEPIHLPERRIKTKSPRNNRAADTKGISQGRMFFFRFMVFFVLAIGLPWSFYQ